MSAWAIGAVVYAVALGLALLFNAGASIASANRETL